ncbi:MAG: flagellar basal body rod protein FlgB [Rhodospirillales bacterium]|nr:flagellar basal body rod protein FlgB [Rhodospirillales bacterium]
MDLSDIPIFKMMNKRMGWLTHRQQILAQNIANSDTPHYKPSDLKSQNFSRFLRPSVPRKQMATTSAHHIAPTHKSSNFRAEKSSGTYETSLSGNSVVVEEQLMKVSETQGGYRLATNLYQKHLNMLKSAIGREGR